MQKNIKCIIEKSIIALLIITVVFSFYAVAFAKQNSSTNKEKSQIIVKYKSGNSEKSSKNAKMKSKLNLKKVETKRSYGNNIELIELDESDDANSVMQELKNDPDVEYVQLNYKLSINTVNEPQYISQWGMKNSGQEIGGVVAREGVDINVEKAWDLSKGSDSVLVGVLDTGIDINHIDLDKNIYINQGEAGDKANNGIDDDNNGYIDDVYGYDFYNNDATVYDSESDDRHGTSMAGIIAARENGEGIIGVAPNIKLVSLKFMSGNEGYTSDAIEAIEYAESMGISIINCSFGGGGDNIALKEAMENSNILFVCAAGNNLVNISEKPVYPASFQLNNKISVASIDSNGMLATYSNYGQKVDVAAPGVNIMTTIPNNGYDYVKGTSASTAFVTGAIALIKSHTLGLSNEEIISRVKENVVKCVSLKGKILSEGRIDTFAAITNNVSDRQIEDTTPADTSDVNWQNTDYLPTDDGVLQALTELDPIIGQELHYGESGVDAASGNFSFSATDMSTSSPGMDIMFSRTYNSLDTEVGLLGKGWTFSFESKVETVNGEQIVSLTNGSKHRFKNGVSNTTRDLLAGNSGSYVLTTKNQIQYKFDSNNKLQYIIDANGNAVAKIDYFSDRIEITDSQLRKYIVTLSVDRISSITDWIGRKVLYNYTGSGDNKTLSDVCDTMGNNTSYSYTGIAGNPILYEIKDTNSKTVLSIEYDEISIKNGLTNPDYRKVRSFTNKFSDKYTYTYDSVGRYTVATSQDTANRYQYWYDAYLYNTKTYDPDGTKTYSYYRPSGKNYGEVEQIIDTNKSVTTYLYDSNGNVIKQTNPDYTYKEFRYDLKNNLIYEMDEEQSCKLYVYDSNNILQKVAKYIKKGIPIGLNINSSNLSLDIANFISNNPNEFLVDLYVYYPKGTQYKINTLVDTISYSEKNKKIKVDYDSYGYMTKQYESAKIGDNSNLYTTFEYKIICVNNTNPSEPIYLNYSEMQSKDFSIFRPIGVKKIITTPKLFKTDEYYDNNNLLYKTVLNGGETARFIYDTEGRKVKEISPKTYSDNNGSGKEIISKVVSTSNLYYKADYNETDYSYMSEYVYYDVVGNGFGKLKEKYDPIVNSVMNKSSYTYNLYGNIETETMPNGEKYKYEYYIDNRIKSINIKVGDNSGVEEYKCLEKYSYNKLYNRTTSKEVEKYISNANTIKTTYLYDDSNRLIEQQNYDYSMLKNEYFADGNLKSSMNENGSISYYFYDVIKRPIEKWIPFEVYSGKTYYTYSKVRYYIENGEEKQEETLCKEVLELPVDANGNILAPETTRSFKKKDGTEASALNYIIKTTTLYPNGKAKTITSNNGSITTYYYDADRNLEKEETLTGTDSVNIIEYENNYLGKVTKKYTYVEQSEVNIKSTDKYDTKTINGKNYYRLITDYNYVNGNLDFVITSNGIKTQYGYDNLNRQTTVISPETFIDKDGNEIAGTIRSLTKYNWENKPTEVKIEEGNNGVYSQVSKTNYSYKEKATQGTELFFIDKIDNSVTEDGILKIYTSLIYYDIAGRKIAEVSPINYDVTQNVTLTLGIDSVLSDTEMDRTEYEYDSRDRLLRKVEKFEESYVDEADNFSIKKRYKTVTKKAYKYDAVGNVVKELDALGYQNGTGTVSEKIETGYGTEYTYNFANKVVTSLDTETKAWPLIYTKKYGYDALGRKISETNAKGVETVFGYNDLLHEQTEKVTVVNEDTSQTEITKYKKFDLVGNVIEETMKSNTDNGQTRKIKYYYNSINKLKKAEYPSDETISANIMEFVYDVMGNLSVKQDTFGTIDTFIYNSQGKQISHTQKKSNETEIISTFVKYDSKGIKAQEKDGNQNTKYFKNDELGRVVEEYIDVKTNDINTGLEIIARHTTKYQYDANNNLLHQSKIVTVNTNEVISTTTNNYDTINRLIEKKDENDKTIQRVIYNDNNAQTIAYSRWFDGDSNQYKYVKTIFAYDRNNRLLSTTDAQNNLNSQTYDEIGNASTKTDGRGNVTTYRYDELNRLVEVINAKTESTKYTYDINNNMLTQTDGKNQTTTFTYNIVNKAKNRIDADGVDDITKQESYTYYPNGLLKTKVDRNEKITTYEYDSHSRMVGQIVGNEAITYSYDNNGNLLEVATGLGTVSENGTIIMTDLSNTITRLYDELNRANSKSISDIGLTTFQYDVIDQGYIEEKMKDPKDNITVKIYDNTGRLIHVKDSETASPTVYDYYENGSKKSLTYPSGVKEEYYYFSDNRLKKLVNKKADSSILDEYSYTYDSAGNQDSKTEKISGELKGTTNYIYDNLNRLETILEPNQRKTEYEYDMAGNREKEIITQNNETVQTTEYSYNSQNRLEWLKETKGIQISKTTYNYDFNGNMIYSGTDTTTAVLKGMYEVGEGGTDVPKIFAFYSYNNYNQLIKAKVGGETTEYTYNGEGLRLSKKSGENILQYLYEYDTIILELDEDGNQTARNVMGTSLISRQIDNDKMYFLYNGHADVTALVDGTDVVATYYYDAFGNAVADGTDENGKNNPFRYSGYEFDSETGLYYLKARFYDASIARFMQEDTYRGTANDPLSLNLYVYCVNNPLIYWDPTGHKKEGDKDLPEIINFIINGEDGETGGLTGQWLKYDKQEKDALSVISMFESFYGDYKTSPEGSRVNYQVEIIEKARIMKAMIESSADQLRDTYRDSNKNFDMNNIVRVRFLLNSNAVEGAGHNAGMLEDKDGNALFYGFYPSEINFQTFLGGVLGQTRIKLLDNFELNNFIKTGEINGYIASDAAVSEDGNNESYTMFIPMDISADAGKKMLNKAVDYFWKPGTYAVLFAKQCDNVNQNIMAAAGKGYYVRSIPGSSFMHYSEENKVPAFSISSQSFWQAKYSFRGTLYWESVK